MGIEIADVKVTWYTRLWDYLTYRPWTREQLHERVVRSVANALYDRWYPVEYPLGPPAVGGVWHTCHIHIDPASHYWEPMLSTSPDTQQFRCVCGWTMTVDRDGNAAMYPWRDGRSINWKHLKETLSLRGTYTVDPESKTATINVVSEDNNEL